VVMLPTPFLQLGAVSKSKTRRALETLHSFLHYSKKIAIFARSKTNKNKQLKTHF
tara:strand:+ start:10 stop:174 length:165 start_codon:yes stop_codon:yes gene_type:complete